AEHAFGEDIDEHDVRVRAAGDDAEAVTGELIGEHFRVADDLRGVVAEAGLELFAEGDRFAAIMWTSGPPCWPGKTDLSTPAAYCCWQRIMPARGPRSVLCVVVVTNCACGTGDGCAPPATRPAKCALSTSSRAPTSSAIARMRGKSKVRG